MSNLGNNGVPYIKFYETFFSQGKIV